MNTLGFMAASHHYHSRKSLVYPNSMSSVQLNTTQEKRERERLYYIQAITWMELKDIMQCERSQSPKVEHYIIPFIWHSQKTEKKKSDVEQISAW